MLKITLCVVGNLKDNYFCDACDEYIKRINRFAKLNVIECPEFSAKSNASDEQIKDYECKNLEKYLQGYTIALDKCGQKKSSEGLANILKELPVNGVGHITFFIGGSLGLTKDFLNKCDYKLSFSDMTFPHGLMRVMLLEQVYRAFTINNNVKYHK